MSEHRRIITRSVEAAVNPYTAGWKGRVVLDGAIGGEAVLSGAAGVTSAVRPLGIVYTTECRLGGTITIVVEGECPALLGAAGALTKGTHTTLAADAAGGLVPAAVGDGAWTVGRWVPGALAAAANDSTVNMLVNPVFD